GRGRRTVLRLSWVPSDPLAMVLTLTALPDHPALPRGSWVVLRDFLRYGLEEPTGDGIVRIGPDADGECVVLSLARAGRPASVAVPCDAVRAFLDRTEAVVPAGAEASDAAIDALLTRLLGEEPPTR
ncbi:MAG: SsgA family sporulation/cell division regulator, partial [Actinomycetes bacterium]